MKSTIDPLLRNLPSLRGELKITAGVQRRPAMLYQECTGVDNGMAAILLIHRWRGFISWPQEMTSIRDNAPGYMAD